ncbi:MAG TPA: bifunctional phosphopantothenoylcysteine decarboxylase/phosphopantothenate--cysteine ligase CoaBC [Bacteroidia bacterium]|nr:bifunctional phosphopantothenoylcysteine decarboxylase/phosphopantothenate--cysteine ligase CoaBC [Bacteroidia bacterium]
MKLGGKKVLLGITGSIAAYKTAELTRLLVKEGAEVRVIMTPASTEFITPLTLATLSRNPVLSLYHDPVSGVWNNHVELGLWADVFVIAPISANSISKLATGQCPDLLSAVYLSAKCPVILAPAMDLDMFAHPGTSENLEKLKSFGNQIIGPEKGELASGLKGEGRMTEPADILTYIIRAFSPHPAIEGIKVLVTAGPTHEALDPVRYLTNHSSGKMGVAVARTFAQKGAFVTVVAGPGVTITNEKNLEVIHVVSADDMFDACMRLFPESAVTVMAAAVADYRPLKPSSQKIKKSDGLLTIEFEKTRDILAEMGKIKSDKQFVAGFALETDNELANAESKLHRKNVDLIVLNSMNSEGAGFNSDYNKITIIEKNNKITDYNLKPKQEVAADIFNTIISYLPL